MNKKSITSYYKEPLFEQLDSPNTPLLGLKSSKAKKQLTGKNYWIFKIRIQKNYFVPSYYMFFLAIYYEFIEQWQKNRRKKETFETPSLPSP